MSRSANLSSTETVLSDFHALLVNAGSAPNIYTELTDDIQEWRGSCLMLNLSSGLEVLPLLLKIVK